ncbi:MAG: alkaline phosphatase family protein [Gammaproteobacteria bacterium]
MNTARTQTDGRRVLVIGLDMGDGRLIRTWMKQGALPNLAAMTETGTWLDLESTAEILHTSTWPSFATGCLPGRHGVYYPFQPAPGFQTAQPIRSDQYARPTLWSIASDHGKRCIAYDVPETFPETDYRGRAVFEWGVWAWYGERASQPATLIEQIEQRFGPYPLKMEAKQLGLKFPEPRSLEKRLIASVEHKRQSLQWLLDAEPWDLAVAVFGETHPAGHYLWPKNSFGPEDREASAFAPMLNVYVAIDNAIGELRRSAGDAELIIVSGDGVRPNHCGWHLLPDILDRLGYTVAPAAGGGSDPAARSGSLLSRIKASLPPSARRWIADRLPMSLRDKIGASLQAARTDWSRSRAFTLPTDLEGYVRINLKGREPQGIVEPGEPYRALCQEIKADLEKLKNTTTGEAAVKKVWVRNEVFPGEAQEYLPDLIVVWNDSAPIESISGPSIGTIAQPSPDPRTGTHSPLGFLLAHGPGVAAGRHGSARLIDVAPTVLRLLGIDGASGADGVATPALVAESPTASTSSH